MLWVARLSSFFSAAMVMVVLSPSLQSFPPAEAIRSSQFDGSVRFPGQIAGGARGIAFRRAPPFRNAADCGAGNGTAANVCDPSLVHIAITLDEEYLRGSVAAVHSVVQHARCPESVFFHFLVSDPGLGDLVRAVFPQLRFKVYYFDPDRVRGLISTSVRQALEQPLNYARNYLPGLLEPCVRRVIYLDSDLVLVDDVAKLWRTDLGGRTVGAPEYCHANFTKYFTARFWSDQRFAGTFAGRRPCYFNTGVMVLDLERWRQAGYTQRIERWMEIQKSPPGRIYELGSLPPFLLVFAGHVAPIEHRWNQHGLGGDNVLGSCRDLHPGPVSLLHWSGSGKPWARLGAGRPCPLDALWAPFDLYGPAGAGAAEESRSATGILCPPPPGSRLPLPPPPARSGGHALWRPRPAAAGSDAAKIPRRSLPRRHRRVRRRRASPAAHSRAAAVGSDAAELPPPSAPLPPTFRLGLTPPPSSTSAAGEERRPRAVATSPRCPLPRRRRRASPAAEAPRRWEMRAAPRPTAASTVSASSPARPPSPPRSSPQSRRAHAALPPLLCSLLFRARSPAKTLADGTDGSPPLPPARRRCRWSACCSSWRAVTSTSSPCSAASRRLHLRAGGGGGEQQVAEQPCGGLRGLDWREEGEGARRGRGMANHYGSASFPSGEGRMPNEIASGRV